MERKVIFLVGEGGTAFDKDEVKMFADKIGEKNEVELTVVGENAEGLAQQDKEKLIQELRNCDKDIPITLIIESHGTMDGGQFSFLLGENGKEVNTKNFFRDIQEILGDKPIDIFTTACYGGGAMKDINLLPKGSTYACLTDERSENVGHDFENMAHEFERFNGDMSAYNLLQFYTSEFLENRFSPGIGVSGGETFTLDIPLQNIPHMNIQYDRQHAESVGKPNYNEVLEKMQTGKLVYAKEFGLACSILLNSKKDKILNSVQEKHTET